MSRLRRLFGPPSTINVKIDIHRLQHLWEAEYLLRELVELNDDKSAQSSYLPWWAAAWETAITRARALVEVAGEEDQ